MATGVYAGMFGFTKKTTVHLSPPVEGGVTLSAQLLVWIEMYKTLDYDQEYKDKALTDAEGRFVFPEKNLESRRPNQLGDETRVRAMMGSVYGGRNYVLWC